MLGRKQTKENWAGKEPFLHIGFCKWAFVDHLLMTSILWKRSRCASKPQICSSGLELLFISCYIIARNWPFQRKMGYAWPVDEVSPKFSSSAKIHFALSWEGKDCCICLPSFCSCIFKIKWTNIHILFRLAFKRKT